MKYRITHRTVYSYEDPVSLCQNRIMMTPRRSSHLNCLHHKIEVTPTPDSLHERTDIFGNTVHHFAIVDQHTRLEILSTAQVEVVAVPRPELDLTPPWEILATEVRERTAVDWLTAWPFTVDSARIPIHPDFASFARDCFPPDCPVLAGARALNKLIYTEFKYDPKATHVWTPTWEAFEHRHGVCQDFSHIMIACLRSLGIPARYVSGYLRTRPPAGKPRLVGADQSHAWVSVWCGPAGWIELDPTNNMLAGTDHIQVACGRDYSDVTPVRGVFLGGGGHTLKVSVDVLPV